MKYTHKGKLQHPPTTYELGLVVSAQFLLKELSYHQMSQTGYFSDLEIPRKTMTHGSKLLKTLISGLLIENMFLTADTQLTVSSANIQLDVLTDISELTIPLCLT